MEEEEEDASQLAAFFSQIADTRKRSLAEASSSSSPIEPDGVGITAPVPRASSSKSLKPNEDLQEIIDIDTEDSDTMMVIDDQGKETLANFLLDPCAANLGSMDGVQLSKSFSEGSHNLSIQDGFTSDHSVDDIEHIGMYSDDVAYHDNCLLLQHHFDTRDIPPGVEASIPWSLDPGQIKKNLPATSSSSPTSSSRTHTDALCLSPEYEPSLSWWKQETSYVLNDFTPKSGKSQEVALIQSHGSYVSPQRKKRLNTTSNSIYWNQTAIQNAINLPPGEKPFKSQLFPESSHGVKKPNSSIISTHHFWHKQMDDVKFPPKLELPPWGTYISSSSHQHGTSSIASSSSNTQMAAPNLPPGADTFMSPFNLPKFNDSHYQVLENFSGFLSTQTSTPFSTGLDTSMSPFNFSKFKTSPNQIFENFSFINPHTSIPFPSEEEADISWIKGRGSLQKDGTTTGSSTTPSESISESIEDGVEDIFKNFERFKLFDTVHDHADHHYTGKGFSVAQAPKNWAKKVQEEWRILEKDLPDTIFVRVYESRLDLLRAVIIGAQGTPYHNGLFVFDFFFPPNYPDVPPLVYYHSGGLRLNPNLYGCGKVCLSLLNTWSGNKNEKWIPGLSTMLQVLVSIQGLILNAKPFFNEPGFASMSGSAKGEKESHQYNERTYILSLKTMLYTMRKPPKHFESFVVGHFHKHAEDILAACKAYMDGAEVGYPVQRGGWDVDQCNKSSSKEFKESLIGYVKLLVKAFTQLGFKDCEKFLSH